MNSWHLKVVFDTFGFSGLTSFTYLVGSRVERTKKALKNMGPAVLNGGFSTFLSFILLATSGSHVFETFFKVSFIALFICGLMDLI